MSAVRAKAGYFRCLLCVFVCPPSALRPHRGLLFSSLYAMISLF